MQDTQDLSNNTGPYPAYTPDVPAPALPSVRPPTAQSMMLAQQERLAEHVAQLDDDLIGWCAALDRELATIKTTLASFQRQQLLEQLALFALVLVALIGR